MKESEVFELSFVVIVKTKRFVWPLIRMQISGCAANKMFCRLIPADRESTFPVRVAPSGRGVGEGIKCYD